MQETYKYIGLLAWLLPVISMVTSFAEGDGGAGDGGAGDAGAGGDAGDAGAAGGGTPNAGASPTKTFLESLPENIRLNPSITAAGITDAESLATSFINAQKLIGKNKIALINDNSSDEERAAFYKALGRPDEPGAYPEIEDEALSSIGLEKETFNKMNDIFHANGLSTKQGAAVKSFVVKMLSDQVNTYTEQANATRQEAETQLQQEFGNEFEHKIALAAAVVDQYGSEELRNEITATGVGNNPELIKFLSKMGEAMLDDTADGKGPGIILKGVDGAKAEINQLKEDKEFQQRLMNRDEVGHKEALARWNTLFKQAYPNT